MLATSSTRGERDDWSLPEPAQRFIDAHLALVKTQPFLVGLGAVGPGHEWAIPKMFASVIAGLVRAGFDAHEIEYFTLHVEQDVDHGSWLEEALFRFASTDAARQQIRAGTLTAASSARLAVVHVGHSGRVLTDPWLHDPAFGALSHATGPAVAPEQIGPLDAILVSHDHPDHANLRALDRLDKRALVLVATQELRSRFALGFASLVSRELPAVRCALPQPGDVVGLS